MAQIREDFNDVGSYLAEKLKLNNFPNRIECYDISHIQGTNTVASMVVFQNGLPKRTAYRKFKVRLTEGKPDDFLSMKEVLTRRLKRLGEPKWEKPDLIIIDGGKGQLSSVMTQFKEMNIENQDIVSLAKKLEEVFKPNESKPVIFPISSSALYFFQRIRDEAHRFAITYHRTLRQNKSTKSILDDIKGLGEKSKKILLEKYKSVKTISELSLDELEGIVAKRPAQAVYEFFKSKNN